MTTKGPATRYNKLLPHLSRSSPEPKSQWWAYSIGRPSVVRRCVCVSRFSNRNHCADWNHFSNRASVGWGTKVCSNDQGHMTNMAVIPIYGKNLKTLFLWNQKTDNPEGWYAASGTLLLTSLFKWWPWADLDIVYGKVKFVPLCFCMAKR